MLENCIVLKLLRRISMPIIIDGRWTILDIRRAKVRSTGHRFGFRLVMMVLLSSIWERRIETHGIQAHALRPLSNLWHSILVGFMMIKHSLDRQLSAHSLTWQTRQQAAHLERTAPNYRKFGCFHDYCDYYLLLLLVFSFCCWLFTSSIVCVGSAVVCVLLCVSCLKQLSHFERWGPLTKSTC